MDRSPHKKHGIERSPEWKKVRAKHLTEQSNCVFCIAPQSKLQVHHIIPFHYGVLLNRSYIELDDRNLITLCEGKNEHHLLCGHLDNFESYNPNVVKWIPALKGCAASMIKTAKLFQDAIANRPKPFEALTQDERELMIRYIDTLYPT
jgi:hypothetical protein